MYCFDVNDNPFFEPSAEFYQIDSNPLIARISTPSVAFGVPVTQLAARTPSNPPPPATIFNAGGQPTLVIQTNTINLISIEGSGIFPQPCSSAPQNCLKRGQRVEGPGIAPDTFVVNLTPDGSNYKAELSKDITSPIAEGEVIQFSPVQNNPTNPPVLPGGIYYYSFPQLAVMETDPVESNLEIFWETSTSGLISDLNTAIINSTNSSVDFSSFNTSAFIESLAPGNNILAASFTLIDELGNPITYAPTVPPQLELIAVRDLNNNTVNIGPGAVFELVRIGSNYNIQFNGTNMPSANPPDSFYFRYEL